MDHTPPRMCIMKEKVGHTSPWLRKPSSHCEGKRGSWWRRSGCCVETQTKVPSRTSGYMCGNGSTITILCEKRLPQLQGVPEPRREAEGPHRLYEMILAPFISLWWRQGNHHTHGWDYPLLLTGGAISTRQGSCGGWKDWGENSGSIGDIYREESTLPPSLSLTVCRCLVEELVCG